MFFDFLQKRKLLDEYKVQNKVLSNLTSTSNQLEALVKNMYRQIDKTHADSVIEDIEVKSTAERFFRDLFNYFSVTGFSKTNIKSLLDISTNQEWFNYLIETNDFELMKEVKSSDSGQTSDILVHHQTNTCISVLGDISNASRKRLDEYQEGFIAFTKLTNPQKKEILANWVVGNTS